MGKNAGPVRHKLDVYDAVLHAAFSRKQWKQVGRELPSLEEPDSTGLVQFVVYVPKRGDSVPHVAIYLDPRGLDTATLVNTIAHEADHGAGLLLDHLGQAYDGNSEAHAYLVGWITQWLWTNLNLRGGARCPTG